MFLNKQPNNRPHKSNIENPIKINTISTEKITNYNFHKSHSNY